VNLEAASKYHRYLILTVLVSLVSWALLRGFPLLQVGVVVVLWLVNVWCCYGLAKALGKSPAFWAVLGFLGYLLIWLPQLLLVNAANKAFKTAGYRVGFLGGASLPSASSKT
jgi:hypothetical protein